MIEKLLPYVALVTLTWNAAQATATADRLLGTEPLVLTSDVGEIVRIQLKQTFGYLEKRIAAAEEACREMWRPDYASQAAYDHFMEGQRARRRAMLGIEDLGPPSGPAEVEMLAAGKDCRVERVALPLADGTFARGLVIAPASPGRRAAMILCPDADTWPERFVGLMEGEAPPPWLTQLVRRGAVVYVPQSIERIADHPYCTVTRGKDRRMILYRLAYPVGCTMPGLDVRETVAAVDYLGRRGDVDPGRIGVAGIGQGGMTALYVAGLDRRVQAAVVADYFDRRDRCWAEPVDRRLPGQLVVGGDAEWAALVAPRSLCVVASQGSPIAAGRLAGEIARARRHYEAIRRPAEFVFQAKVPRPELEATVASLLADKLALAPPAGEAAIPGRRMSKAEVESVRNRHFEERLQALRQRIADSEAHREARWKLTRRAPHEFPTVQKEMLAEYRRMVGEVATGGVPLRPRSALALAAPKYRAYRVLLDVAQGLEVYGNLLVPEGIQGRAAAVVCQHGLSGTPEMITGLGQKEDTPYHEFGRRLAERGYVVFAPLVLHYHPVEWTNQQARMADAVGMMRVALAVAQTRRVVDFLQGLPFVDRQRIGYYGLSYGGYSALWISPLEDRLAAVVVSGHFNDWRAKITSDATATSYLLHPDEDFYTWDILHRFTHVELVAMDAPRPVCIEYGVRDGITTPEWTARAWKQLAAVRDHLGLGERIVLAQFDGVHEVRCEESFAFLDRFLR